MAKKIADIEGIGPVYAEKLKAAGVRSVEALLKAGGKPGDRKALADKTGLSGALILRWVNMADSFRIKGVGEEYSDLLEASDVDSVPELAQRNADNLHAKMIEVNAEKKLVRATPGAKQVASWVEQAKGLPRSVHH